MLASQHRQGGVEGRASAQVGWGGAPARSEVSGVGQVGSPGEGEHTVRLRRGCVSPARTDAGPVFPIFQSLGAAGAEKVSSVL
jgi:hypothetical protein